jgi:hypothetical protein
MTTQHNEEFQDMYGSRFLGAADIDDGAAPVRARIIDVTTEPLTDQATGKPKPRYVLHFAELRKPLPLNKTNAKLLASTFTEFPSSWKGALVDLFKISTPKGDGVRFRIIKPNGGAATTASPKKYPDDSISTGPIKSADLNDEITF